jgi:ABC-type transporter Mla subunit MlaD
MQSPAHRGCYQAGRRIQVDTRRTFVAGLFVATVTCGLCGTSAIGQNPAAPVPGERRNGDDNATEAPLNPAATKKILEDNEKDIKKKIERLYELATDLKAEVDKTDSSKVLSLNLVKKADEIEKLAHDIKNRSKG